MNSALYFAKVTLFVGSTKMTNYTKICVYLRQNSTTNYSGVLCKNPCTWRWVLLPLSSLPSPLPNR